MGLTPDKRRFYNEVLAPLKSEYKCAVLCMAHPPLPSKDAHKDSQKRARGSGDITAQADRLYWLGNKNEERTPDGGMVVTVQFGGYEEREARDAEGFLLTIDGAPEPRLKPGEAPEVPLPLTVTGLALDSDEAATELQEEHRCQMAILAQLNQRDGAMYQPEVFTVLVAGQAHKRRTVERAIGGLVLLGQISKTAQGKTPLGQTDRGSGKWLILATDDE